MSSCAWQEPPGSHNTPDAPEVLSPLHMRYTVCIRSWIELGLTCTRRTRIFIFGTASNMACERRLACERVVRQVDATLARNAALGSTALAAFEIISAYARAHFHDVPR